MKKFYFQIFLILIMISCAPSYQEYVVEAVYGSNGRVVVTFPENNHVVSENTITITGTTESGKKLESIEYKVNNGDWHSVSGNLNWEADVILSLGQNSISIRGTTKSGKTVENNPFYIHFLWEEISQLPANMSRMNVLKVNDSIHIIGGVTEGLYLSTHLRYTESGGTETMPASLVRPSANANVAFNSNNNTIIVVGGFKDNTNKAMDQMDVYDLNGSLISSENNDNYARAGAAYAQAKDKLYIMGGYDKDGNISNNVVEINLTDGTPSVVSMNIQITYAGAVAYDADNDLTDEIIVFGGNSGSQYLNTIYVYDPDDQSFTKHNVNLINLRARAGIIKVGDKVYIVGGEGANQDVNSIEVFYLNNSKTDIIRNMPFGLKEFGLAYANEVLLIFGGKSQNNINKEIYKYYRDLDTLNN